MKTIGKETIGDTQRELRDLKIYLVVCCWSMMKHKCQINIK